MHVPGTQKVYVLTFGCSHNISDSEYMSGLLASYGYDVRCGLGEADVVVVNSCTVKDPSQAAFLNAVRKAQGRGQKVVVCGCVPQAERGIGALRGLSVVGVTQIDRIVEAVEETLRGSTVELLGRLSRKDLPELDLPKIRRNPLVEIVPLSTGCLGNCT
ncbi:hypothetical protein TeGR_g12875, partial [Tetraparma gracilis]